MQTHSRPFGPQNRGNEVFTAGAEVGTQAEGKWHVQVAAGDVRLVTLDKLDDLFRYDVIDEDAFVWQPGMAEWKRLSELLGQSEPDASEQEEPFYVCFAPNDIRVLSLEQLDDLYRLSVIDEATLVWQDGMAEWQTLGKLAGLNADPNPLCQSPPRQRHADRVPPSNAAKQPQSLRPPAVSPTPTGALYQPTPQQRRPSPPLGSAFASQQSTQMRYTASSARSLAESPPLTQHLYPVPSAQPPTMNRSAPQPIPSLGPSSPPITLDIEPEITQRNSAASWLMRAAFAAGVLLALVRNDMIHRWVQNTQLESRYAEAETKVIGSPAFGTTRAVEQLVAECGGHLESVRLPIAVTQYVDSQKRHANPPNASAATEAPGASAPSASSSRTATSMVPKSYSESPAPGASPRTDRSSRDSNSIEPQLSRGSGKTPTGQAHAAQKGRSRSGATPKPDSPHPVAKTGLKGSGSYFDPLNGAL